MMKRFAVIACASALIFTAGCRSSTTDAGTAGPSLVSHTELAALLPNIDGWQRTSPRSGLVSLPAPATNAATSYARGATKIDLEITDTGGAPEHIQPMSTVAGSDFTQTAANGYMKGTMLGGFPAIESWNHVDHVADLSILINGRFIVHASGTDVDKVETVRQLLEQVDLQKIATLK